MLVDAGFADVRVEEKVESREFIKHWMPGSGAEDYVVSANVTAYKPAAGPVLFGPFSFSSCFLLQFTRVRLRLRCYEMVIPVLFCFRRQAPTHAAAQRR